MNTEKGQLFLCYGIYSALANYYMPPTKDMLLIADKLLGNNAIMDNSLDTIKQNLINIKANQPSSLNNVKSTYHDLFVGITGGEVSLYACEYISGSMFGKQLIVLRDDLKKLGFTKEEKNYEPEDHISSIFEVMVYLVSDFGIKEQANFFYKHIAPFIDLFCLSLKDKGDNYYKQIAGLTLSFIDLEKKRLSIGQKTTQVG